MGKFCGFWSSFIEADAEILGRLGDKLNAIPIGTELPSGLAGGRGHLPEALGGLIQGIAGAGGFILDQPQTLASLSESSPEIIEVDLEPLGKAIEQRINALNLGLPVAAAHTVGQHSGETTGQFAHNFPEGGSDAIQGNLKGVKRL
jgi:hypothetical protein